MGLDDAENPVIFFDGVCNLCNSAVNFVIDHDPKRAFRFAALQSEAARNLLGPEKAKAQSTLSTVLLVEGGLISTRSTAALRVARRLGFPWNALYIFTLVPTPLRDWVYNVVADHRYRWFGKRETCRVPTPELKRLFLD